ncbi:hypothetical protein [Capnocytophaga canis]|nr:hypothetical protein [Capnocytophaga canis]
MEKIQVEFYENGYNSEIQKYKNRATKFKKIVDKVLALGLNIELQKNDLEILFLKPKSFFTSKIVTEPVNINGLTLNKEKVFDILLIPNEIHSLISEIEALKETQENGFYIYKEAYFFELSSDNEVTIKHEAEQQIRDKFTIYLTTEKQVKAEKCLKNIIKNLKELQQIEPNFYTDYLFEKYLKSVSGEIKIDYETLSRI